jgi:hypothetical protein
MNDKNKAISKQKWNASHQEEIRAYNKAYYASHIEEYKTYNREWRAAHPGAHKAHNRAWYIANVDKIKAYNRKRKAECPEEVVARNAINNGIRDGRVFRPDSCSVCGKTGRLDGHHRDYTKPLDVVWLCISCHRKENR